MKSPKLSGNIEGPFFSLSFFPADCADHSARYLSFTKLQFDAQTTVFVQESSKQRTEGRGGETQAEKPSRCVHSRERVPWNSGSPPDAARDVAGPSHKWRFWIPDP